MSKERDELEKHVVNLQTELAKIESDRDGKESGQKELKVNINRKQKLLDSVYFLFFFNLIKIKFNFYFVRIKKT